MISREKFRKLPLSVGRRKTIKIFREAEYKFLNGTFIKEDLAPLAEILDYWIARTPEKTCETMENIRNNLQQKGNMVPMGNIRRDLALVQYLMQREMGNFPSEWDFDALGLEGKLDPSKRKIFKGMGIYLEDIRSPFNVGAMFRCAESFGAEKIYLSPICADPGHPRSQRTAMGCTEILPWTRLEDDPFAGKNSFPRGTEIFALETGGTPIEKFKFPCRGIMIAGSEELGVSPAALAAADASLGRVSIPVYGAKGSLNVSVAFGIAMHTWAAALAVSAKG